MSIRSGTSFLTPPLSIYLYHSWVHVVYLDSILYLLVGRQERFYEVVLDNVDHKKAAKEVAAEQVGIVGGGYDLQNEVSVSW